jgi:hypothetical protein
VSVGAFGQYKRVEGVVVGGFALRGCRCLVAVLVSIERVNMKTTCLDVPWSRLPADAAIAEERVSNSNKQCCNEEKGVRLGCSCVVLLKLKKLHIGTSSRVARHSR